MKKIQKKGITVALLTISTGCYKKERIDTSGDELENLCKKQGYRIIARDIVTDNKRMIKKKLKYFSDKLKVDLILTTGGTGLGPFDLTPEATQEICKRTIPGIAELIRSEGVKKTKRAVLSRCVAGIREKTLIINLPGSPKAVKESFNAIAEIIPHSIEIINGAGHY